MSMLAERKRKVKWSLNPRGKAWSEDANKFGQKMLEKMGWQQGKGLGPDGKGMTEHIKTTYKNDNTGMGYKMRNDQWTEHGGNFTSLLASLNGEALTSDEIKVKSLEKKSETSKARVHYHKFTRGKDLTNYSEKDLANIFGKKTLKDSNKKIEEEKKSDSEDNKYDSGLLLNAGSMRDYFKKKIPNFGKTNGFVVGQNGVLKKEESESESEAQPSFGFGFKSSDDTKKLNNRKGVLTQREEVSSINEFENICTDKNKSKEIAKVTFVSYTNAEGTHSDKKSKKKRKGEDPDEYSIMSPKKKSKNSDTDTANRKSKGKVEGNMGVSNPAFDPMHTPIKMQKHVLNPIQESTSELEDSPKAIEIDAEVYVCASKETGQTQMPKEKKKRSQNIEEINSVNKKLKRKKFISGGCVNEVVIEDIEDISKNKQTNTSVDIEENEVHIKKKKKKNSKLAIDNPNFDETTQESINTSQVGENPYEVKIKNKKKKKERCDIENPNFSALLDSSVDSSQLEKVNGKKKKKKVTENKFAISNPSFNDSAENAMDLSQVTSNPYEITGKDKKKVKVNKYALSNPSFNGLAESSIDSLQSEKNPYEVKVKDKKKKKKMEDRLAQSNPSFNGLAKSFPNSLQIVENPHEVKGKKKKKIREDNLALSSPSFNGLMESSLDLSHIEGKVRDKKKASDDKFALSNPSFNGLADSSMDSSHIEENPYEVKVKSKKKTTYDKIAMSNPNLNGLMERSTDSPLIEVKVKNKKKKGLEDKSALSNSSFNGLVDSSMASTQIEEISYEVKAKDKKKKKKIQNKFALTNPSFNGLESSVDSPQIEEMKVKDKKLMDDKCAIRFNGYSENSMESTQVDENPYEVIKRKNKKTKQQITESSRNSAQIEEMKDKKKKKKETFAIDNPHFDPNNSLEVDTKNNNLEVERKKKKPKKVEEEAGIDNPVLNLDNSQTESKDTDSVEIESDIMLNVISTPILAKSTPQNQNIYSVKKVNSVKRTKSVRFSDVTQERIIPNNDELKSMNEGEIENEIFSPQIEGQTNDQDVSPVKNHGKKGKKRKLGLDNAAFDKHKNALDENLDSISKTIDKYQAEIENDINEKKLETFEMDDIMVGEVGNPQGENERLSEGCMLRFKYAQFKNKTPIYQLNKTGSKKSYRHLIKGDIVVKFKDSNLHEIDGYAVKRKNTI